MDGLTGQLLREVGVALVAIAVPLVAAIKYVLPQIVTSAIEHAQNRELKHLEASLRSHAEMLKTSAEVGYDSGEQLRAGCLEAAEKLWDDILRVEREFATLVSVESILTDEELVECSQKGVAGYEGVRPLLEEYASIEQVMSKLDGGPCDKEKPRDQLTGLSGSSPNRLERERLFVTGELWRIYEGLIRLHGRLGFLASRRMATGEAVSWKNDPHSWNLVEGVVPADVWEAARKLQFSGFRGVTGFLRQQFVMEARRSMGGTDHFAATLKEYRRIMEEEEAEAREKRKQYQRRDR